jgi:hypothetical protein
LFIADGGGGSRGGLSVLCILYIADRGLLF